MIGEEVDDLEKIKTIKTLFKCFSSTTLYLLLRLVGEEESALVPHDPGDLVQVVRVLVALGAAEGQGKNPRRETEVLHKGLTTRGLSLSLPVLSHEELRVLPFLPDLLEVVVPAVLHREDEEERVFVHGAAHLVHHGLLRLQADLLLDLGQGHLAVAAGLGHRGLRGRRRVDEGGNEPERHSTF